MLSSSSLFLFFFFNDTATTEIYTLSLHDALPIWRRLERARLLHQHAVAEGSRDHGARRRGPDVLVAAARIAGAIRGTRARGQRGGGGRALRDPAAHLATRRLGIGPERSAPVPRGA